MKPQKWIRCVLIGVSVLTLLVCLPGALAASRPACALVLKSTGTAEYWSAPDNQWLPLRPGIALQQGHTVRTGAKSTLDLGLTTHALVGLRANSQVRLTQLRLEFPGMPDQQIIPVPRTRLTLEQGAVFTRTAKLRRPGSLFAVETSAGVAQAKATSFLTWREGNQICLRAMDDAVSFTLGGQTVTLQPGQQLNIPIDPATGQAVGGNLQPVPAPGDDAMAQAYQNFLDGTGSFESMVLGPGPVSLEQLLAALGTGGAPATTPTLMVVGNPGSITEVSPSTP